VHVEATAAAVKYLHPSPPLPATAGEPEYEKTLLCVLIRSRRRESNNVWYFGRLSGHAVARAEKHQEPSTSTTPVTEPRVARAANIFIQSGEAPPHDRCCKFINYMIYSDPCTDTGLRD
jgi:hypothetical protein